MGKTRDTYKYYFKKGNRIVHGGITDDLGSFVLAGGLDSMYA